MGYLPACRVPARSCRSLLALCLGSDAFLNPVLGQLRLSTEVPMTVMSLWTATSLTYPYCIFCRCRCGLFVLIANRLWRRLLWCLRVSARAGSASAAVAGTSGCSLQVQLQVQVIVALVPRVIPQLWSRCRRSRRWRRLVVPVPQVQLREIVRQVPMVQVQEFVGAKDGQCPRFGYRRSSCQCPKSRYRILW